MLKSQGHDSFEKGKENRQPWIPQEELFDQGKLITLEPGKGEGPQDGIYTGSNICREWTMVVQPTAESLAALRTAGVLWGVLGTISSGYISTSGLRLLLPLGDQFPFPVPVAGFCFPVHGSFIEVKFSRPIVAGAPQVNVQLIIYGLPGRPTRWNYPDLIVLAGAGPFVAAVGVRTFAAMFTISGQIDAGDTLEQRTLNGTLIQSIPVTSDYANNKQPVLQDAGVFVYTSVATAKRVAFNWFFRT